MSSYKVICVGESQRGKSEYITRHFRAAFDGQRTQGVEVYPYISQDGRTTYKLWDCAGDFRYRGLDDAYFVNADAAIIFADTQDEIVAFARKIDNVRPGINKIVLAHPNCIAGGAFNPNTPVFSKDTTSLVDILG
jgi:GTPase SAR1 family protein